MPCAPPRLTRPLAIAFFGEQSVGQDNEVQVVRGPGLSESGILSSSAEEVGLSLARGLAPWLNFGVTAGWRHVRMEGESAVLNLAGDELSRITIGGDSNKVARHRRAAGHFRSDQRPHRVPPRPRLPPGPRGLEGGAHRDRPRRRRVTGPRTIDIEEPPLLAAGAAWRPSDTWLFTGEVDYIWYDRVTRSLERNLRRRRPRRPSAWTTGSSRGSASR